MPSSPRTITVPPELDNQTLAAALRALAGPLSWSDAKRLVVNRHVEVSGSLSLNDARRLRAGEVVVVYEEPRAPVPREQSVRVLHVDADVIVVEKPAGIVTLRRDEEREMSEEKKDLQPTLDELIPLLLPGHSRAAAKGRPQKHRPKARPPKSTIYAVHRLDRDTSGLMLFALNPRSRDAMIELFKKHAVNRTYRAVVHGRLTKPMTLDTQLVRDRGDGLRGSLPPGRRDDAAQRAVTHIRPIDWIRNDYSIVECRLETGRTHQIRIHLAEAGHVLCGEKLYLSPAAGAPKQQDDSGAPRQALHSATLEFTHPMTGKTLRFTSDWPRDMAKWIEHLREMSE